ncbi:hypothetical protein FRX31_013551 [Thalictrum thalictroides]|uniref:Secreted protein n=1 Tax=Thalictrum thalictroides TaxID=46969 RepID=A0A7J6WL79_THATH|nr:hypothetical protein FRX31_013551 [Thalictrum thalictroides]
MSPLQMTGLVSFLWRLVPYGLICQFGASGPYETRRSFRRQASPQRQQLQGLKPHCGRGWQRNRKEINIVSQFYSEVGMLC